MFSALQPREDRWSAHGCRTTRRTSPNPLSSAQALVAPLRPSAAPLISLTSCHVQTSSMAVTHDLRWRESFKVKRTMATAMTICGSCQCPPPPQGARSDRPTLLAPPLLASSAAHSPQWHPQKPPMMCASDPPGTTDFPLRFLRSSLARRAAAGPRATRPVPLKRPLGHTAAASEPEGGSSVLGILKQSAVTRLTKIATMRLRRWRRRRHLQVTTQMTSR